MEKISAADAPIDKPLKPILLGGVITEQAISNCYVLYQ